MDFKSLDLPVSRAEALFILSSMGIEALNVDLISIARKCIGISRYKIGASNSCAPERVNCSSFTKWVYGMKGIWLPHRAIQQYLFGDEIPHDEVFSGDLIFASGKKYYDEESRKKKVGHVGIVSGPDSVIHATNTRCGKRRGVFETTMEKFVGKSLHRGFRRILPTDSEVLTLKIPEGIEVETSDDIRWIILNAFPR